MFQPEKVTRDDEGRWRHSVLQAADEETDIEQCPEATGMEFHYADMENEASDIFAAYVDGSTDLSQWNPKKPDGDGWFLIGIYDNEEGAFACFVRPKVS